MWFRKKHILIKVGLADGSTKTVLVDLTQPVRDFLPAVSKKSFLKNIDEYSFKVHTTEYQRDKKKEIAVEKEKLKAKK